MRIQKYLSQQKVLSRRETEDYIRKGLIKCNGKVVRELGFQMNPEKDKIEIVKSGKAMLSNKITVAINKPRGIVSSPSSAKLQTGKKNKEEGKTLFEIFPEFANLNAVGRLDKDSEGLILLSNDGVVTSSVTGSEHKIEKEYEVTVREDINNSKIKWMERGLKIEDGMTLPAKAMLLNKHSFRIILKEGRKHQIRRMCAALNLTVLKLRRLRIGNINLKGLRQGEYRALNREEIEKLKNLAR